MDKLTGWIKKVSEPFSSQETKKTGKTPAKKTSEKPFIKKTKPHMKKTSDKTNAEKRAEVNSKYSKPSEKKKTKPVQKKTQGKPQRKPQSQKGPIKHTRKPRKSFGKKGGRPDPAEKGNINVGRLKYERKKPTNPSRPVQRKSVSRIPKGRKQRPRPMLGQVKREISNRKFPMYEKLPKGDVMRIIPLGGLNEVGKNSMAIEFQDEIILIDIGLQFPEENMPGIDYVIPDLSYVLKNKEKLKGVVITHGHLDHIGAIHHYIERLGFPTLYATRLTKALIEKRLEEHDLLDKVKIVLIDPMAKESRFSLGKFTIEYCRVNHSIPDAAGIYIKTEAGSIFHTGDFKFDFTPVDGMHCDYEKMARLAKEGVDMCFADSTNAIRKGFCPSEKAIERNIDGVFRDAIGKRLIMATFASSIGRLQSILLSAVKHGRKIFLGGRSMIDNIRISQELGVISVPRSAIRKLNDSVNDYRPEEVLILTTGSQGEPFAALSRISRNEHPHITISEDDIIAFSSSPIPGNERSLYTVIDAIYRKGAAVMTKVDMDIHASGHAFQGDIKMMHSLLGTKYVVPIHGEYFMRIAQRRLVIDEMGYDERNVIMLENGGIVELRGGVARRSKESLNQQLLFVDGKDHADMTEKQLNERQAMAEGGLLTLLIELDAKSKKLKKEPRIYSEGFLENPDVHGVIIDTVKTKFAKLHQKFAEKITEKVVVEELSHELKVEMLREVAREPVIQIIVSLG